MKNKFQVLIVAADPLARSALAAKCTDLSDFQVVGLSNPSTAADHLAELQENGSVNLLIWDLGWEASGSASSEFQEWDIPLLLLLSDSDQSEEAWSAGAQALLKREASGKMIETAAYAVSTGLVVIDPELATSILPPAVGPESKLDQPLTPREMEVLQLLAEGLTNKAIAVQLDISRHTVKFHVNAILSKLDAQSRTEAVVRATRFGLLAL